MNEYVHPLDRKHEPGEHEDAVNDLNAHLERKSRREVVSVGWDGASRPMLRYRDELHLPDGQRSIVKAEER